MPPHVLLKKVVAISLRKTHRTVSKMLYLNKTSFGSHVFQWRPPSFQTPNLEFIEENWPIWEEALKRICNHEFDLLGSDWTQVAHGNKYKGLEGAASYPPTQEITKEQLKTASEINSANKAQAREILKHITEDYVFIDWHVDFKSGYRWNPATWWEDVPYGHQPGVDIKVPWELSRMQHLPWLAYGFLKTKNEKYKIEFQNQILDFIANNPPRFGVNWKCPMDVAIRAANWSLAFDLFRSQSVRFSPAFENILGCSLIDHGLFVSQNFEKAADFRGNHYLADIAGLTFIAFAMEGNHNVDEWKVLCTKEVLAEARYQFHQCGTNFEGSTAYHRLSSEMLFYPLLLLSLNKESSQIFAQNKDLYKIIVGAESFAQAVTKPDGKIVQIGDNDSGRFFKLSPAWEDSELIENHLDLKHLSFFTKGFLENQELDIESSIICRSIKNHKIPNLPSTQIKEIKKEHFSLVTQDFTKEFSHSSATATATATAKTQEYYFPVTTKALNNLTRYFYKEFGVIVYKADDFFLSFRCGPVGQLGRGGHDHNDQLSVELYANGMSMIQDPGTYLYTPSPAMRNKYRSNQFHFTPQPIGKEMADIESALFFIGKAKAGEVLDFNPRSCSGVCNGFGFPIVRRIEIFDSEVKITDSSFSEDPIWNLNEFKTLPFSRGYGFPNNV